MSFPPRLSALSFCSLKPVLLAILWHQALLLSHPRNLTRDTQHLAHKNGQSRGSRPALRNLVRDMFAVPIQGGEHSSVNIISHLPFPSARTNFRHELTIVCVCVCVWIRSPMPAPQWQSTASIANNGSRHIPSFPSAFVPHPPNPQHLPNLPPLTHQHPTQRRRNDPDNSGTTTLMSIRILIRKRKKSSPEVDAKACLQVCRWSSNEVKV